MTISQVVLTLLLGGVLGLFGQGIRTVVGLKTMVDYAAERQVSQDDLFSFARIAVGLVIGFLAGIATTFVLGLNNLFQHPDDLHLLLGLAAGGYAGTDAIEAFISRYLPGGKPKPQGVGDDATAAQGGDAHLAGIADGVATVQAQVSHLMSDTTEFSLPSLNAKLDAIHGILAAPHTATVGDITDEVTTVIVKAMFPATPITNITRFLPFVLEGMRFVELTDKAMINMALSTIRAETEGFRPIPEGKSRFNTSPGSPVPFNLYEPGTKVGRELGNTQVGDGARFKGRGFVQLTGRSNYREFGPQVGADLVANPDLADDPTIAGKLLGVFLRKSETAIRNALRAGNLREARKLVNGGENGFANFQDAYTRGVRVLPDGVAGARPNGAAQPHAAMA